MFNVVEQFQSAMGQAGIATGETIIPDGQLHRIHIHGHRHGTKNGAYLLHLDGCPAGWFQDFKTGVTGTWRMDGRRFQLTRAQRQAIEQATPNTVKNRLNLMVKTSQPH